MSWQNNEILFRGAKKISLWRLVFTVIFIALPVRAVNVPLAWDPSSDPNVAGYKIYYGLASHVYTSTIDVGNVTNTTITGLSVNTTYFFAATTYDASGLESGFSNEATYTTSTNATSTPPVVYQPPTLNPVSSLSINENAGLQTINLTGISLGSGQSLSITAVSSNPALIANPTVNYSSPASYGSLSFTPTLNASGTTTITMTANNGLAQSNIVTRTFNVTVNPVYQPPTLNPVSSLSINENAGLQTVNLTGISLGTGNAVTITAVSSNPALIANLNVNYSSPASSGSLSFTPALNASGTTIITVTANNGLTQSNLVIRTFNVTVAAVNQPPTLDPIGNLTFAFNSAAQTVNLTGISPGAPGEIQPLIVSAVSSNPNIVPNPAVAYSSPKTNGTLTIKPVANTNGSATITVTVNDGAPFNHLLTRTFAVAILANGAVVPAATVVSLPATLSSATRINGHFSFTVNGVTGKYYAVQASSDMINWTPVQTNTTASTFTFEDSDGTQTQRFYRTVEVVP